MKSLKKHLAIVLAILLLPTTLSFVGCSKSTNSISTAEIWAASAKDKIMSTQSADSYADIKADKITISAVKNEYENGQIIVTAKEDLSFTVSLSDLVKTDNAAVKIGKENFSVYIQKYITVTRNWHNNGAATGDYPDAILPQENAVANGLNTVIAGRNGAAWLEFYIPKTTQAGVYAGDATVKIGNAEEKLPIELTVYDITLPDGTTSKSQFNINQDLVAELELDSSQEMYDKYTDLLLSKRLSPTYVVTGVKNESDIARFTAKAVEYYKKGISTIGLPTKDAYIGDYILFDPDFLSQCIVALAKAGLAEGIDTLSKAVFYDPLIDEPFYVQYADGQVAASLETFDQAIASAKAEIEADVSFDNELGRTIALSAAKIPHIVTDYYDDTHRKTEPNKNADGSLFSYEDQNVSLCPKFDGYDTAEMRAQYDTGIEKWWYGCNEPNAPYASYHLEDTLTSATAIGWMMGEYNVTGNLYWSINHHMINEVNLDDPYQTANRGANANGDGYLIYPGKVYGIDGPVGSIRLDAIRDGNEDYELIMLLKSMYETEGADATALFSRIRSDVYENTSMLGGSAEFGEAREMLFNALLSVSSPAKLMVTSIVEYENSAGKKAFDFIIKASADAEVYLDGEKLTAVSGEYAVTKTLDSDKNYLTVTAKHGTESVAITLYLGGRQSVCLPESLSAANFSGDITEQSMDNALYKLLLSTQDRASIAFTHDSLSEIGKDTASYVFNIYNYGGPAEFTLYVTYSGYGKVQMLTGTLNTGANSISLNDFATVNWAVRKSVTEISFSITGTDAVGFDRIVIYGV